MTMISHPRMEINKLWDKFLRKNLYLSQLKIDKASRITIDYLIKSVNPLIMKIIPTCHQKELKPVMTRQLKKYQMMTNHKRIKNLTTS
jgi:hypothetical protein